MWTATCAGLHVAGLQALSIDLPGHGEHAATALSTDTIALATWLCGQLDAAQLPRVHVIAHGAGTLLAQALAAHAPERVARLVLADATHGLRSTPIDALSTDFVNALMRLSTVSWQADLFARAVARYSPSAEGYVRAAIKRVAANPERYRSVWSAATQLDTVDCIKRITAPTLLLCGDRDPRTHKQPLSMAKHMHDAQFQIIPEAGSLLNWDNPTAFDHAVFNFLLA